LAIAAAAGDCEATPVGADEGVDPVPAVFDAIALGV
jgi:hypothetical protein